MSEAKDDVAAGRVSRENNVARVEADVLDWVPISGDRVKESGGEGIGRIEGRRRGYTVFERKDSEVGAQVSIILCTPAWHHCRGVPSGAHLP